MASAPRVNQVPVSEAIYGQMDKVSHLEQTHPWNLFNLARLGFQIGTSLVNGQPLGIPKLTCWFD
jgi:hypothetical protein